MNAFVASIYNSRKSIPLPLFDFDYEQTGRFSLSGSDVISYTHNDIVLTPQGSFGNNVALQSDGVQLGGVFNGSGLPVDNGKKLAYNGNVPFNYAFLVVAEGRLGTTSTYNNVLFTTTNASSVSTTYPNGLLLATNNAMSLRSNYRITSTLQSHRVNQGNLVQTSNLITLSFGTARAFKIIRVKLNSNNVGEVLSLGGLYTGNSGYSHSRVKRLALYQCTDADADVIYTNLRAYYSL